MFFQDGRRQPFGDPGSIAGHETCLEHKIHIKVVSARQDRPHEFPSFAMQAMPFTTWQVFKDNLKHKWPQLAGAPSSSIRLLYKGVELRNSAVVDDYNMEGGSEPGWPIEIQYLIVDQGVDNLADASKGGEPSNIGMYVDAQVHCTPGLKEKVQRVREALAMGIVPKLSDEGTGATYMMRHAFSRDILAVFKPKDEEAFAPNNPRDYKGKENTQGLRQGVLSTTQAAREVAAHLLDHKGFAGVPQTTLVHAKHPNFNNPKGRDGMPKIVWKIGAFQEFMSTIDTAGNLAPSLFNVQSVHHIGILDIRIVNLDRNDGNMLARRPQQGNKYNLVPIDHGLSLPDRLEVYASDMAWMSWPQAKQPFDSRAKEYIMNLQGAQDALMLAKSLGIRRECLRLMEVTTMLLQIGTQQGLTLYDIGTIMYRDEVGSDDEAQASSTLEKAIHRALTTALAITGAGDRHTQRALPASFVGLDLATSRTSMRKIGRQTSHAEKPATHGEGHLSGLDTPHMRPTASPTQSPTQPQASEMPAMTLDGHSGSEQERDGESAPWEALSSTARKRSSAAQSALRRREHSDHDEGGIFVREGLRPSDWPQELELVFKAQIRGEITRIVEKRGGGKDKAPAADTDATCDPSDKEDKAESEASSEEDFAPGSLLSAFGRVRPGQEKSESSSESEEETDLFKTLGAPSASAYVPPHIRKARQAAAEAEAARQAEEAAAKAEEDAKAKKPEADEEVPQLSRAPAGSRYVPPQERRRREAEEAAKKAAAQNDSAEASGARVWADDWPATDYSVSLPSHGSNGNSRFGFSVHQGPRASMEDATDIVFGIGEKKNIELYGVYDGHNGCQAVKFIRDHLPQEIVRVVNFDAPDTISEGLKSAFQSADLACLEELRQAKPTDLAEMQSKGKFLLSSGCVGVVALVVENMIHVANLGDCRAILCNNGDMVSLTEDHRPEVHPGEKERLEKLGVEVSSDGYVHGRIAVSRAFGDMMYDLEEKVKGLIALPECNSAPIVEDSEFLLIGCDGVFEKMSDKDAGQIVRRRLRTSGDPKDAAEALVRMAERSTGSDNLSAIVVLFKRPAAAEREAPREAPRLFGRRVKLEGL